MIGVLEQVVGGLLVLFALLDVFLTVLYARIGNGRVARFGTGVISAEIAHRTWQLFRWMSGHVGRYSAGVLSFCAPVILVLIFGAWALLLALGAALIIHPRLGTGVRATTGPTPTDFATALYAAGTTISTMGSGDLAPRTAGFRLMFLVGSLVGISVITLTVTFLVQLYNALQQRNAVALKLHLMGGRSNDAARFITALGPGGHFDSGYTNLAELAGEVAMTEEAHHFHPVLFYFRFQESYYGVSHVAFEMLDAVALIRSALSREHYGWLQDSASVELLGRASLTLVQMLDVTYLPDESRTDDQPDERTRERWRRRYRAALATLREGGVATTADEHAGGERYLALRAKWQPAVARLARFMAYDMEDISPHPDDGA